MLNYTEMSKKIEELVKSGKTMEEALKEIMTPATMTTKVDRVEWIKSLATMTELKDALHKAHAKKSKSKGTPAEARYQLEIDTAKARLKEFREVIDSSEDPVAKAVELGEELKTVVQKFISIMDAKYSKELQLYKESYALSNVKIKELLGKQDSITPGTLADSLSRLGKEYLDEYNAQLNNGNQWITTLNKKVHLVETPIAEAAPTQEVNIDQELDQILTSTKVTKKKGGKKSKK